MCPRLDPRMHVHKLTSCKTPRKANSGTNLGGLIGSQHDHMAACETILLVQLSKPAKGHSAAGCHRPLKRSQHEAHHSSSTGCSHATVTCGSTNTQCHTLPSPAGRMLRLKVGFERLLAAAAGCARESSDRMGPGAAEAEAVTTSDRPLVLKRSRQQQYALTSAGLEAWSPRSASPGPASKSGYRPVEEEQGWQQQCSKGTAAAEQKSVQ